jgi:hypothetical protein
MTKLEITWWAALLPIGKPLEDGRAISEDAAWSLRAWAGLFTAAPERRNVGSVNSVGIDDGIVFATGIVWDAEVAEDMAAGKLRPAVDLNVPTWTYDVNGESWISGPVEVVAVTLSDSPAWPDARFEVES